MTCKLDLFTCLHEINFVTGSKLLYSGDILFVHEINPKVHVAECQVRVSEQSCKQANRLILWGRGRAKTFFFSRFLKFFLNFFLKKYELGKI